MCLCWNKNNLSNTMFQPITVEAMRWSRKLLSFTSTDHVECISKKAQHRFSLAPPVYVLPLNSVDHLAFLKVKQGTILGCLHVYRHSYVMVLLYFYSSVGLLTVSVVVRHFYFINLFQGKSYYTPLQFKANNLLSLYIV